MEQRTKNIIERHTTGEKFNFGVALLELEAKCSTYAKQIEDLQQAMAYCGGVVQELEEKYSGRVIVPEKPSIEIVKR